LLVVGTYGGELWVYKTYPEEWSPACHWLLPKEEKESIWALLRVWYRKESEVHKLPKDILYSIFRFFWQQSKDIYRIKSAIKEK
jgi:hypothetical protein